jgi:hypothetical protein
MYYLIACCVGGAKVYDVTKYLSEHPGGPEIMMEFAGQLYFVGVCIDLILPLESNI